MGEDACGVFGLGALMQSFVIFTKSSKRLNASSIVFPTTITPWFSRMKQFALGWLRTALQNASAYVTHALNTEPICHSHRYDREPSLLRPEIEKSEGKSEFPEYCAKERMLEERENAYAQSLQFHFVQRIYLWIEGKKLGTHCNASSIRSSACRILFSPHLEGSETLAQAERDTCPPPTS